MASNNVIWPQDLNELSETDLNFLVNEVRERRSKVVAALSNAKNKLNAVSDVRLRAALDKELLKFTKSIEKADKAIAEVEKKLSTITALRLQLEDISNAGK